MMQNLCVREDELILITNVSMLPCTYAKLRAHSAAFLDISNPKAV